MSFISKIQRPADDYLARLVAKTRRDDEALLSSDGPLNPAEDDLALLLAALADTWPGDQFDELNIALRAPAAPLLLAALNFLDPRVGRDRSGRRLSRRNELDILRWMLGVAGREIAGLRLSRNPGGWATIEIVGRETVP
jgi:hypothetical protein